MVKLFTSLVFVFAIGNLAIGNLAMAKSDKLKAEGSKSGKINSEMRNPASNLSYEDILSEFFAQSGQLKSQDGKVLASLLGADLLQHYSGSEGNKTLLYCEVDEKSCRFTVEIFYRPRGNHNGLKQKATYLFDVNSQDGKAQISNLRYSITDPS